MRTALSALSIIAITAVSMVVAPAVPVSAAEQDVLRITEASTISNPVVVEYAPIPGQSPLLGYDPDDCAHEFSEFCDVIPVDIVVPELEAGDEFMVSIIVSWDPPPEADDIDVYFFDDKQMETAAGEEDPGYTEINSSASASKPEKINQYMPMLGRYNLVVTNWVGANAGYKVTAFMSVGSTTPPFEVLAPEFSQTPPPDTSDDVGPPPFDFSATPPPGGSGPVAPTFGEIPVQPDTSLDFGPSDFEDNLAAPPAFATGQRLVRRPPRPVPGLVAGFWLGAVPLALTAAFVVLLARRRRDSLAYA